MTGNVESRTLRSLGKDGAAASAGSVVLGNGIRAERVSQGLTLSQLGDLTGLSVSALSQIERGIVDPSIGSLRKIAAALSVPMFHFLAGVNEPSPVVRQGERKIIQSPDRAVVYELLTPDIRGPFEILGLTLSPGCATSESGGAHDSDESIVVLRGRLTVELAGQSYDLADGDSIFIRRQLVHRVVNRTAEPVDLMIVISPANY